MRRFVSPEVATCKLVRIMHSSLPLLEEVEFGDRLHAMLAALRECSAGNTNSRLPPIGGALGLLVEEFNHVLDGRSQVEAELRRRNAALEISQQKLSEQADMLRQKTVELEEARTSAEQSNRTKSSFLANVSHEIRTPMTSILGFTELLLDDDSLGAFYDRHAALDAIRRNGRRGRRKAKAAAAFASCPTMSPGAISRRRSASL